MTYVKTDEEMPVDEHEIMRYAGVRQRTEALALKRRSTAFRIRCVILFFP